jgi:hypothetical protein
MDLGTVAGTSWSEVTISWDDGEASSVSHNDMARVEQGETANIKQNTTNAGFFKGRRVK